LKDDIVEGIHKREPNWGK